MEDRKEINTKSNPKLFLVIVIIIFLFALSRMLKNENSTTPVTSASKTPTVFVTPANTKVPEPTPTKVPAIPGLQPADIKVNLENKDFECTNVKTVKTEGLPDSYLWYCDRDDGFIEYDVEIFGNSIDSVYAIDANVMQTINESAELAEPFLSWFSTVAFLDSTSKQTEIKNLVSSTLKNWDGTEKTITKNGVKFSIYGTGFTMILSIQLP
jgi:hypothetical protein